MTNDNLNEKTRQGAMERQKQIELAKKRKQPSPLGRKMAKPAK